MPTAAVFEYAERYRRIERGWLRQGYRYEYRPVPARRAHHDHPPHGIHQHCRDAGGEGHSHYVDRERLLEEVHEEFERLFLAALPVDCADLRQLR
jgi:hypothetical protein